MVPGFIVSQEGDTIRGFVENRSLSSNIKVCYFAAGREKGGELKAYYPSDIRSYGLTGLKYYQSITIKDQAGSDKKVFATILMASRAGLYRYRKSTFIVHDSLGTHDLTFNGVQDLFGMNRSRGKLNFLFADCKTIRFPWDSIILNDDKIMELTRKYNACRRAPIVFRPSNEIPAIRNSFGLLGGYDASSYQFASFSSTVTRATYHETKFTGSSVPVFGVWWAMTFPRLSSAFSVYSEITSFSSTINGFASGTTITGNPETEEVSLKSSYLRLALGLRVLIPMRGVTPFIKVGVSTYQASGFVGTRTHNITVNGILVTDVTQPWDKANLAGFWMGAGLQRKITSQFAISAEARLDIVNGFSGTNTGYPLIGSHTIFMVSLVKR
jgi:hypothetical protein